MPVVVAEVIDKDTLEINGARFVREDEEEVLLRPIYSLQQGSNTLAPKMQCSNCGYSAGYWSWYHLLGFKERYVKHCPGCGKKIFGTTHQSKEG